MEAADAALYARLVQTGDLAGFIALGQHFRQGGGLQGAHQEAPGPEAGAENGAQRQVQEGETGLAGFAAVVAAMRQRIHEDPDRVQDMVTMMGEVLEEQREEEAAAAAAAPAAAPTAPEQAGPAAPDTQPEAGGAPPAGPSVQLEGPAAAATAELATVAPSPRPPAEPSTAQPAADTPSLASAPFTVPAAMPDEIPAGASSSGVSAGAKAVAQSQSSGDADGEAPPDLPAYNCLERLIGTMQLVGENVLYEARFTYCSSQILCLTASVQLLLLLRQLRSSVLHCAHTKTARKARSSLPSCPSA